MPTCEIITIGSELLLGQIADSNTVYLARELGGIGVTVSFRTTVGDNLSEMEQVIKNAVERCDVVLVTGGLGPTKDDLTREAVGMAAGVELEFRQDLMDQIARVFRRHGYDMSPNNRRQAYVPEGSEAISNPVGTAPGFIKDIRGRPVICLPGVPKELKYLLDRNVKPWLKDRFHLAHNVITYHVLKVVGMTESRVDRLIGDLMRQGQNPEVGLLASLGEIKIRISAKAKDENDAIGLIGPVEEDIRSRLGRNIFGMDGDTLEGVIDDLLVRRGLTLALLETFSGGLAAQRLHALPSSQLLESTVIADKKTLGRRFEQGLPNLEDRARDLAGKISRRAPAGIGLAIIGFPEKREGAYFLKACAAVSGGDAVKTFTWEMGGDVYRLQQRGAVIGLNTLRLALLERP